MKGPSTRLSKPGPPVRPLAEKALGTVGEVSKKNPGAGGPRVAPEGAPNVSAREADDVNMGDDVAQSGISDAESIGGNEGREPRRRNSPSDPMSREIEDPLQHFTCSRYSLEGDSCCHWPCIPSCFSSSVALYG